MRDGYPVWLTSYTGMPSSRGSSNAASREATARRVHSPSCAMSTTVVAVTLVGGSTNASTPRLLDTKAARGSRTALLSTVIPGPSAGPFGCWSERRRRRPHQLIRRLRLPARETTSCAYSRAHPRDHARVAPLTCGACQGRAVGPAPTASRALPGAYLCDPATISGKMIFDVRG